MKKILYILIVAMTLLGANSIFAYASDNGNLNDSITWKFDNETKTLTISGNGDMPNYTEKTFTPWKEYSTIIENIVFEDGVTAVADYGFTFCDKVKTLSFPDSIKKIGKASFGWCYGLENVEISNNIEEIDEKAFIWCRNLKTLNIPSGVKKIGSGVILWATSFEKFTVSAENSNYSEENGVLYNKDKTVLLAYPASRISEFDVPYGVHEIATEAFLGIKIKGVNFSETVKKISNRAFMGCMELENVTFKNGGIEIIDDYAFSNCKKLEYVVLPKSLTKIGNNAFTNTEIKGIPSSYAQEYALNNNLQFSSTAKVFLNDVEMDFNVPPIIIDGYTLVPMRKIFESLGANVEWDNDTNTAIGTNKDTVVKIQIGNKVLTKNGVEVDMNIMPQLIKGNTMVPLRAISEAFAVTVDWNQEDYVVTLNN